MSAPFTGVLAVVGRPSNDGRTLGVPANPLTRALRVPLFDLSTREVVGSIERVWIDDDLLRYSGRVADHMVPRIREDKLVAGLDARAGELTEDGTLDGWSVMAATLQSPDARVWPEVSLDIEPQEWEAKG